MYRSNPFSKEKTREIRRELEILSGDMRISRRTMETLWREQSEYISPRKGRFWDQRSADRAKVYDKIVDSTGRRSWGILVSGLMGGVTPSWEPWSRFEIKNFKADEDRQAALWFEAVNNAADEVRAQSNFYPTTRPFYGDYAQFSNAMMLVEEDIKMGLHYTHVPVGEYYIMNDAKGNIGTFMREYSLTTKQIIEEFATDENGDIVLDNVSRSVANSYKNNRMTVRYPVTLIMKSNPMFVEGGLRKEQMKFIGFYYEGGFSFSDGIQPEDDGGGGEGRTKFLRVDGYRRFPAIGARWSVTGNDDWGTDAPGESTLPDIKVLQYIGGKMLEAIDNDLDGAKLLDNTLKGQDWGPGNNVYADMRSTNHKLVEKLYDSSFDYRNASQERIDTRTMVKEGWFVDLFLAILQRRKSGQTATEIEAATQEKHISLGPMLTQLTDDFLKKHAEVEFDVLNSQGRFPPPPESIQGEEMVVNFVSTMFRAQRTLALPGIERVASFVGNLASVNPNVLMKLDEMEAVDEYAKTVGVPPNIIRPDSEVERMRAEQQAAQQEAQQQDAQLAESEVAKNLGAAKTQDSMLGEMLGGP